MRIVVVGATGNVGTSVVRALARDPRVDEIVAVARRPPMRPLDRATFVAADVLLLARESKSLLIGEHADTELSDSILRVVDAEPSVTRANGVLTMQLAPDQIVAALSLDFEDHLTAAQIEDAVIDIERKVRESHPQVVALFIKPQTDRSYRQATGGYRSLS